MMGAKFENIVKKERSKLEDVIPLDTPYSLCIDPSNVCNFNCKFCAIQDSEQNTGGGNIRKQFMPLLLFQKIIDDISTFPNKLKVLRLVGQGEPLLNPNYIDMTRYAKSRNVADFIETITNGSKLNATFNQKLVDSGLNRIRISVEGLSSEEYYNMAGKRIDFSEFVANIKDLYEKSRGVCEIYVKTVDAVVNTEDRLEMFNDIFGNICDKIFVDKIIPMWSDFEEISHRFDISKEGVHGQKVQFVKVCPYPFYSLMINPDGEVTLCCADWKRKFIIGNASNESIQNIWNGERLRIFWKDMLEEKKSSYEMCSKCVLPMYDCNDNIDQFAVSILKRLEQKG